jgi:hypothetical protein
LVPPLYRKISDGVGVERLFPFLRKYEHRSWPAKSKLLFFMKEAVKGTALKKRMAVGLRKCW